MVLAGFDEIAFLREPLADARDVMVIMRFENAANRDGGDVLAGECPVVMDFVDAGAFLGDNGRKIRHAAWAITDSGGNAAEASIGSEAALKNAAQSGGINIPAAEGKDDGFALEFGQHPGQASGERGRPRTFDNGFFQFEQAQNGDSQIVLANQQNAIDQAAADVESVLPDRGDGQTIRDCGLHGNGDRFARFNGRSETGRTFWFHTNHADVRFGLFNGGGNSRDQAGSSDGNNDRIEIGNLLHHFERERALPGNDSGVIIAINVREAEIRDHQISASAGLRKIVPLNDDFSAELAAVGDLG